MEGVEWKWPGARWWRCDLHVHSPASSDYAKPSATADEWVRAAAAKLDVVAVTDHNSGRWFGDLRRARDSAGLELAIFPGVEVNCTPGIHLVVLFDPSAADDVVAGFLGRLDVPNDEFGNAGYLCDKSFVDVVACAREVGGLCIAAHVDSAKGLLHSQPRDSDEKLQFLPALVNAIHAPGLLGLEVKDASADVLRLVNGSEKHWVKKGRLLPWLACSDAHKVDDIGARYTWAKMSKPNIEGLRLALLDRELSIKPEWSPPGVSPNEHSTFVLKGIRTKRTKHIGRSNESNDEGLLLEFSPWFTAIIGGRGTGKSTIVDLLRMTLERDDELDGELQAEFRARMTPPPAQGRSGKSLLLADSETSVGVVRAGGRFRALLHPVGRARPRLDTLQGSNWSPADGRVRDRIPVRIYGQKQIYELASDPSALLRLLDSGQGAVSEWVKRWDELCRLLRAHRQSARSLRNEIGDETKLRGQIDDLGRQIGIFESMGHAELLKAWHRQQTQEAALARWTASAGAALDGASVGLAELGRLQSLADAFDQNVGAESAVLDLATEANEAFALIRSEAETLIVEARSKLAAAQAAAVQSTWAAGAKAVRERYASLVVELRAAGVEDPDGYAAVVRERQRLTTALAGLVQKREELARQERGGELLLKQLMAHRRSLSEGRQRTIDQVLGDNKDVRIRVIEYGARDEALVEFRKILGKESEYDRDVGEPGRAGTVFGRLFEKYSLPASPEADEKREERLRSFEGRLSDEKARLERYRAGAEVPAHQSFAAFLRGRREEFWDTLETWFPPDDLRVEFRGRDAKWQSVETGSPGQRTAALLSFLLSLGNEPIILDQPEDDLDNQLVYELVVEQIRKIKSRRQVIVVTHNANIVVNGDAECVVVLGAHGGRTRIEASGGLQEDSVRRLICSVMEGGSDAFERRWQRLGNR